MISKCFNYETDAARALAKGDNVSCRAQKHPFCAYKYIYLEDSGFYLPPHFNTRFLPKPHKLTPRGCKNEYKNNQFIFYVTSQATTEKTKKQDKPL